ncbi:adhesion G protein-coupled receptor L4 isoform X1 [Callorhinchus milii]|uniref:Adhesion G protein-coupled receptor L4 n=1 Tax=Callorhinchus milii TaxID=7868 RepID=V9KCW1_CALMI|nr:adhesion G protein-coupled receptor L4 isoform X1 [Callorhinchus milii]|eukprot:gi/632940648/ref/XP_007885430.1/ PREDICTED: EGF, latrophilin and seven transmembrane domain-containing protein 1 isoform X1 [Callorhinchus milii]
MKFILLFVWLSSLLDLCLPSANSSMTQTFNCNENICNKNATCTTINKKKGCYCNTGFTGDGVSFCNDDDECENATQTCGYNATCTNTIGSFYCTCVQGFQSSKGTQEFTPNDGSTCIEKSKTPCHLNNNCLSGRINDTLEELSNIKEPKELLETIARNTTGQLSAFDVLLYIEVLSRSIPTLSAMNDTIPDKEMVTNVTINALVKTVNSFLKPNEIPIWKEIAEENRKKVVTKLLHTMEKSTLGISQHLEKATQLEFKESDIALKLYAFDSNHINHSQPHATFEGNHITISPRKTEGNGSNGTVTIIFIQYDNIGSLLKLSNNSREWEINGTTPQEDYTVNSHLIAAAIKANPSTLYPMEHVTFTLKHLKLVDIEKNINSACAFWDYSSESMEGHWSTEGCESLHFNATHTMCRCYHLTNFAVLMSSAPIIDVYHNNVLTRITQLGIIVSLICLSICIFTFCFFSEIQSTRTTIHKNLCFSLFIAELLFLTGINMNGNKLWCSIIAGLLHYFFLAAFAWMCIEGIHLYLIVVGVIYNKGFLHRNFYIFGYGSPSIVVGISAILGYKYYGKDKICWLSTENNFIWSFIGPACLIILVNLLAFGVIIYKVFRHISMLKPEVSCYENIRSCARGALALLFLLGATWTFGVLHIIKGSMVTAYLFTVSNTFQGMFIFIFLCIMSKKIQKEYYRLFKNVPCCFGCLR